METMLVRLKSHDSRRGQVLRRYTYQGIRFQEERGWYRVEKPVAEYLRTVRQQAGDPYSPPAFDVCSDEEAKTMDTQEKEAATVKKTATDEIKLSVAKPAGVPVAAEPSDQTAKDDRKQKAAKGS